MLYKVTNKKLIEGKNIDISKRVASFLVILLSFKKLETIIALYGYPPSKDATTQVIP